MSAPSRQLRAAACDLEGHGDVAGVEVRPPEDGETEYWELDIAVYGSEGVDASILQRLAEHDLTQEYCKPQSQHYAMLATLRPGH